MPYTVIRSRCGQFLVLWRFRKAARAEAGASVFALATASLLYLRARDGGHHRAVCNPPSRFCHSKITKLGAISAGYDRLTVAKGAQEVGHLHPHRHLMHVKLDLYVESDA